MALFAQAVSTTPLSIVIDEGNELLLTNACACVRSRGEPVLQIKCSSMASFINVCAFNEHSPNATLDVLLRSYDSPVAFKVASGEIHVLGRWKHPSAQTAPVPPSSSSSSSGAVNTKKRTIEAAASTSTSDVSEKPLKSAADKSDKHETANAAIASTEASNNNKNKKTKPDATITPAVEIQKPTVVAVAEEETAASVPKMKPVGTMRKKWRVKPQNEEGILVPEIKTVIRPSGVTVTDFVVGVGPEPKLGSKVKIVYEGMFPDGNVFDARLTRSKPLVFRKGTGQVIRGLDQGMEGMRVGGSREICIPSELGYGKDGYSGIPPNQDLVFRVTLIGLLK